MLLLDKTLDRDKVDHDVAKQAVPGLTAQREALESWQGSLFLGLPLREAVVV